jgi:hypothetical protein
MPTARLAALGLLALLYLASLPTSAAPPTAAAAKAGGPVNLDGVLDEPAWAAAQWYGDFVSAAGDKSSATPPERAPVQTRFKVVYDDSAIYVAVECDEPKIENLKASAPWRDGAVWADDCVEVFFSPTPDGRTYSQVMTNSRGMIYDSYGADFGTVTSSLWNGAFRAAGHVDAAARKWTVEVEIPFGTVLLGDQAGSAWRWNVTRERQAGGNTELTSWSPLRANFHQPKLFGMLTGLPTDYSPFRFSLAEPTVDVSGTGSGISTVNLSLKVRNETGADHRVLASASPLGEDTRVQAEPVAIPAGQEGAFAFPPLSVRAGAADVVFTLQDADTKRVLKAVAKNLSSEYRPIAVELLKPCYRNSIYATEKLKEIVFQVALSPAVSQAASEVAYELVSEAGASVAKGRATVAELARPLKLPADRLTVGKYTLKIAALGKDGRPQAQTEAPLRKLPPPPVGAEVRIDENRNLLINGKPVFTIGWYGSLRTEDPRAEVVALQDVQTPVVVSMPDASSIGKAFAQHHLYSVVSAENGRLFYSFNLWQQGKEALRPITEEFKTRTEPSEDARRLLRELVEAVRGEPGMLGYYIADEPEINNMRSVYLENQYQYLCELDPYHPVMVTNDTIDGIVTHGYKCADVLNPDPYSPEWDYVPNFLKKVNEVGSRGKSTYVTLWHSSSQAHFTQEYGTAPPYPYRVMRNQYFASIAYGAKGFTAYTSSFFLEEIQLRYGLPPIWRELRFLEKAILAPPPEQPVKVEGAPELATFAREVEGKVYLIAVHHKPGTAEATLRWPPLKKRTKLIAMSEGREAPVRDGAVHDRFAEGDVHIYTDDPAARSFPTVQSILADLAKREQEAIKPGNLLHWTKGVKARASEGFYAPWFSQYFYYAINGITDDTGWNAYGWGNKPAWLELTLKQPATIGRVVIYTPNLRDYDLDLAGPGGEVNRAHITGNEQTVVTHNFNPPVPCLKLRLTATAVREGTPRVAEIEAYAEAAPGPTTPVQKVAAAAGAEAKVLFGEAKEPNALWSEDFKDFQVAPKYNWDSKDTKWVTDLQTFHAKASPGGGVTVASAHPQGYAGMTHIFPYEPAYRFFQVDLTKIVGKGYQFTYVGFGNSSGAPGYRGAVNTARPGIYTVDTHYISDNYRTGKDKQCFLTVGSAGSAKNADGTVTPGPEFTFDWLRLVRLPLNGLIVTLPDGSPLGDAVKQRDTLHLELHLEKPAQDAVVEVQVDASYSPLAINGQPYVQLRRADAEGRVWAADVTLGPGTGKFEAKGYPPVFKATITGGAIPETYATASVSFR